MSGEEVKAPKVCPHTKTNVKFHLTLGRLQVCATCEAVLGRDGVWR